MAISASTVFEIRAAAGASDTNGGGFVTGTSGTDYSQQNSKNTIGSDISVTNGVTAGTTTVTSATANFSTGIVGNIIYIQGGTGSIVAGWYQVLTRVSATTITVDRATGLTAGTGVTINIGGALASIGNLVTAGLGSMFAYVQAGTYTITSATANVPGGCVSTSGNPIFVGYSTNRTPTNTDTPPLINFGVSGISLLATRGTCINMAFSGNGQTTAHVAAAGDTTTYNNCSFTEMNVISAAASYVNCSATANSVAVFVGNTVGCVGYNNSATPFSVNFADRCISINNTGTAGGYGVLTANPILQNCIAYGNASDGFITNSGRVSVYQNCHAENNGGWGFNLNASFPIQNITNCSAYNNTLGANNATAKTIISGFIPVTAGSVFTNAAGGDFSLNNTVGQGALLRAAGVPASFPTLSTLSYLDIGAAQHQDSGGSVVTVAYTFS